MTLKNKFLLCICSILEQNLMAYARQMFFLALLYDQKITSRSEKAKMFLEILGNVELRESTFKVKTLQKRCINYPPALPADFFLLSPFCFKGRHHTVFLSVPKNDSTVKLDYEYFSTLWTCTFQQSILCT